MFLRIALGAVLLYAAYSKLRHPWLLFAMSVDSYRILPSWAVFSVARTLPWLEFLLGVLLVAGWFIRYSAPAVSLLLGVFCVAMFSAYTSGSGIDCGCFGIGEAISPGTLARDAGLFGCSIVLSVLVWRGTGSRSRLPAFRTD